jgi:hypothetical protein
MCGPNSITTLEGVPERQGVSEDLNSLAPMGVNVENTTDHLNNEQCRRAHAGDFFGEAFDLGGEG